MQYNINIKQIGKLCGIYIIKNNINDMVYIGRSINILKRIKQHIKSFKLGKANEKLCVFIKDNPNAVFTFELLEKTNNIIPREEYFIKKYDSVKKGFNILEKDADFVKNYSPYKKYRKNTEIIQEKFFIKKDLLTNNEILDILQRKRKISAFARFLKMSVQGIYKLLGNNKPQYNQYGNYIEFIRSEFENG